MDAPVVTDNYQYLGRKTLWLFILNRSRAALILLIISGGMFFLSNAEIPEQYNTIGSLVVNWHEVASLGVLISFFAFVIVFCIAMLVGWLVYIHYKFSVGEHFLRIKRGVLNKQEVAIPFRQIQDVTIVRDLAYQAWGLSKLLVQTAGHPAGDTHDAEGILPAIDRKLAEHLQAELLRRANAEKTTPANQ
ncbi:MAG: PH domain-containing protein [Candidatus Liptonbacteria bacterium]|nr:PH domain-containing protein [Candidatus Liptonbacteria bacterium]